MIASIVPCKKTSKIINDQTTYVQLKKLTGLPEPFDDMVAKIIKNHLSNRFTQEMLLEIKKKPDEFQMWFSLIFTAITDARSMTKNTYKNNYDKYVLDNTKYNNVHFKISGLPEPFDVMLFDIIYNKITKMLYSNMPPPSYKDPNKKYPDWFSKIITEAVVDYMDNGGDGEMD